MELSEAKEILEDRDMLIDTLFETYNQSTVKPFDKAIDTVLKALDNSISKDEVRKKIEEIEHKPHWAECGDDYENEIKLLKELLG